MFEVRPPRPGLPLPCPVRRDNPSPPPFALLPLREPFYVPGLPGFVSGEKAVDDEGVVTPKFDGLVLRGTRVVQGRVEIPPGGFCYMADTMRSTYPGVGCYDFLLGRRLFFVDYDLELVLLEGTTVLPDSPLVVGDVVYVLGASPRHEGFRNVVVHAYSVSGIDWDFAGMSPVSLPIREENWYSPDFVLAYNQGRASHVSPERVDFAAVTGMHLHSQLVARERPYFGPLLDGGRWAVSDGELSVSRDGEAWELVFRSAAQEVRRRMSPPWPLDLLPEDQEARRSLQLTWNDGLAELLPQPEGPALRLYHGLERLVSGLAYPRDPAFAVANVSCPIGHSWSVSLYNPQSLSLVPGESVEGPEGYFRLVLDDLVGEQARWHFEDRHGNASRIMAKSGNLDTLVGGGRVVQHLLARGGTATVQAMYRLLGEATGEADSGLPNSAARLQP